MSDETMRPVGGDELPVVDEVLAAQGEPGLRALDLLQDGRLILTGGLLRPPAEVAEWCLRGAADALLSLPGAPEVPGARQRRGRERVVGASGRARGASGDRRARPEAARLVGFMFGACPPERAGEWQTRVCTALGAPPPTGVLG